MFCSNCGAEVNDKAVVCVKCGCALSTLSTTNPGINPDASSKDWIVTLLLCFFLGYLGIHRFYVGKTGTAIFQLLTAGGCGVWVLIDLIIIAMGNFTDAEGKKIANNR